MFRKELEAMLAEGPATLSEIARRVGARPKDVEADLVHLERSLRHEGRRLVVEPAACLKCDFEFDPRKVRKPGKCPRCRGTWISEPLLRIV